MRWLFVLLSFWLVFLPHSLVAHAQDSTLYERLKNFKNTRALRSDNKAIMAQDNTKGTDILSFEGREILVYVPKHLQKKESRALVMIFHGGMGNAGHVRTTLSMESTAEKYGFIIAYMNGTKASRLDDKFKAWNGGGGCCGKPFKDNLDDVGYIERTARFLSQQYGISNSQIFGMGHSNGAIVIQRTLCERGVFSAIIPLSGPLNLKNPQCSGAKGRHILAIHGQEDKNVPIGGGYGTKGITDVLFQSQAHSKEVFEHAGADYTILTLPNTDHSLKNIMDSLFRTEHMTLPEKAARFFAIDK